MQENDKPLTVALNEEAAWQFLPRSPILSSYKAAWNVLIMVMLGRGSWRHQCNSDRGRTKRRERYHLLF